MVKPVIENKVVIMIPTLNRVNFLKKTLKNLLLSVKENRKVSLVIFDNASNESYEDIKDELLANERCHYERFAERLPAHANWNRCISKISANYIAFYHDDDIYDTNIISKQIAFLDANSEVGLVCTNTFIIDEEDNVIGTWSSDNVTAIIEGRKYIEDVLLNDNNMIHCSSVMFRSSSIGVKPFKENLQPNGGDIVSWLILAKNYDIGYIGDKLMYYRKHRTAETSLTMPIKAVKDVYDAYVFFIDTELVNIDKIKLQKYKSTVAKKSAYKSIKLMLKAYYQKDNITFELAKSFIYTLDISIYNLLSKNIQFLNNFILNRIQ